MTTKEKHEKLTLKWIASGLTYSAAIETAWEEIDFFEQAEIPAMGGSNDTEPTRFSL